MADDPQTRDAGGSFMPFMMGYMMGAMMRSGAAGYTGRPLYRDAKTGGLHSSGGDRMAFTAPGSKVSGSSAQIRPVTAARPAPPMTRAAVASAGGFGAARTAALRSVGG